MNIEELINQHEQWRNLVESLFNEYDSYVLNPINLLQDDKCDLGIWIYSQQSSSLTNNETFKN